MPNREKCGGSHDEKGNAHGSETFTGNGAGRVGLGVAPPSPASGFTETQAVALAHEQMRLLEANPAAKSDLAAVKPDLEVKLEQVKTDRLKWMTGALTAHPAVIAAFIQFSRELLDGMSDNSYCTAFHCLVGPVMQRVTSREFQRNFGRLQDEALKAPLTITRNGRERLVILSAEEYTRLKRRDRQAIAVENLSDADIEAILRAEPPAEAAQYDHELAAGRDANT